MLTSTQIQSLTTALSSLILLVSLSVVLLLTSAFLLPDDNSVKPTDSNWERSPIALKSASLTQQQLHGKTLFTNNCAQCHAISRDVVVGPGLAGVTTRTPGEAWLLKWVRNSQMVVTSGDAYAVGIYNKFNKVAMPAFPNFTDTDVKAILAYVDAAAALGPDGNGR